MGQVSQGTSDGVTGRNEAGREGMQETNGTGSGDDIQRSDLNGRQLTDISDISDISDIFYFSSKKEEDGLFTKSKHYLQRW
jgi:hypothetical protein